LHVNGKRVPSIVKSILYVRRRKEALKIQRRQTWGPLPGKILGLTLDVTLLRGVQLRYLTLRVKLISGLRTWITTLIAIPSNNLNIIYCTWTNLALIILIIIIIINK
jgi:hypothetical protein